MKKILISLPQIEWSIYIFDYIRYCFQLSSKEQIDFYVISKNLMDESIFPCALHPNKILDINEVKNCYDIIINLDSDPIVSGILSSMNNYEDLSNLLYSEGEKSCWEKISNFCGTNFIYPKFRININNNIKSYKAESGIAIKSDDLRMFIKNAFFADNDRLWHVPIRKNLVKRYIECNSVQNLVTDDYFCALSSYAQGKKVIFLKLHKKIIDISIGDKLFIQDASDFLYAHKI